jgi:hypothetical protein
MFGWALPNLIVPLFVIPIAMGIQWMFRRRPDWKAVIEDGQLCFYSVTILGSAWYDLKELPTKPGGADTFLSIGMDTWILMIGGFSMLGYGIMASDHLGARALDRDRAAVVSILAALASIGIALHVHRLVVP